MGIIYEDRLSDSPYIEKIGHFYAEDKYSQVCTANVLWSMLLVTRNGKMVFSIWGPETQSALMNYPKDTEFLFIQFKLGGFMPHLPIQNLVNRGTLLPEAGSSQSFWLDSCAWQYPNYENADTFVDWLVRDGLLVYEPIVEAVIQDRPPDMSPRTVRHRFLRATGLTRSYIHQLERARKATALLEQGVSILDTVYQAGYSDQAHMTRSLKRLIGQTPAQIAGVSPRE